MSDNLRIRGQSSGQGFGGKRGGSLFRFKRGRQTGDLVRGLFLRLEASSPGLAWVSLEGEELLAQLPADLSDLARRILAGRGVGATPTGLDEADFPLRPGSACYFVVEALEPEPVLRMIGQREQGAADGAGRGSPLAALRLAEQRADLAWRELAALPPAQLAARYGAVRTALDNLLQKRLWPAVKAGPAPALERLALYRRFARDDAEARALYSELALHRAAMVNGLGPHGLSDLLFVPWLAPGCLAVDLALLRDMFILQARLPQGRRLEARGRTDGGVSAQRLLPPGEGDLLSFLLGLYPAGGRGGFSRRA